MQITSRSGAAFCRRLIKCGIFFSLLILSPGALAAEVIQLKNGTLIEGRIVSQDQKRVVLKTANGQRVVTKTSIRRIVYDPGMGARLIGAQKRKAEAAREAARQKKLADERAKKAAEVAKSQEQEAAKDAASKRREARAARLKYAALVEDYQRRAKTEEDRLAREQALLKKQQEEQKPQPDEAVVQKEEDPAVEIDRWGALWRSAILPGWGQFYAGSPIFGTAYSGLFAFGAVNSYNLRRIALSSRNDYRSFTDTGFLLPLLPGAGIPVASVVYFETSRRSETYARNVKRQQQSIQLLGGIYLAQLIHAAFLSTEVTTAVFLNPDGGGAEGVSLFVDQVELEERDQFLGAGQQGLDSRLGFGYSLRF